MSERAQAPGSALIGWDVGGAHLKACRVERPAHGMVRLVDAVQWPCALWQGLPQLDDALARARARWPDLGRPGGPRPVATMTGEMVDLFAGRAEGVVRLADHLGQALGPDLRLYAGPHEGPGRQPACWVAPQEAGAHWARIASANWAATAQWLARRAGDAVLVDVGSTTSDLVALRDGGLADPAPRGDAERLARGELVYQGVVRTPLCALGAWVSVDGRRTGVMNEFFATSADVHRLLGGLRPAHDQQPAADQGGKDLVATCRRLARMVGRDADEAGVEVWRGLALQWRERQLDALDEALQRVAAAAGLPADAPLVAAGCGDFLVPLLADRPARGGTPPRAVRRLADLLPVAPGSGAAELAGWGQVAAPAAAVALLAAEAEGSPPCG